jgi:hypothetical protein
MCKPEIRKCLLKLLGVNMVIFAPITIALGIADLSLYQQLFCNIMSMCVPLTNAGALTWVSVAIWAPLPIFANGVGAIWIANRPFAHTGWLCLLSFLNTIAFGPAIVIITALELSSNKFVGAPQQFPPTLPPQYQSTYLANYGIEITITIIGGVLFLHALAVLYLNCCCSTCIHEEMAHTTNVDAGDQQVYIERRKAPAPAAVTQQCAIQDPYSEDIDRMNMWSAYRWMNNGGAAVPPATRTNYYALGAAPTRCAPGGFCGAAGPYYGRGSSIIHTGGPAVARW